MLILSLLWSPFVILSIDSLILIYPLISSLWLVSWSPWNPLELTLYLWLLENESFLWSSERSLVIYYFCWPFYYFRVKICSSALFKFLLVTLYVVYPSRQTPSNFSHYFCWYLLGRTSSYYSGGTAILFILNKFSNIYILRFLFSRI